MTVLLSFLEQSCSYLFTCLYLALREAMAPFKDDPERLLGDEAMEQQQRRDAGLWSQKTIN